MFSIGTDAHVASRRRLWSIREILTNYLQVRSAIGAVEAERLQTLAGINVDPIVIVRKVRLADAAGRHN